MTKARSNATAEAAKGDLRAGTGTNLSGILAVGNNGETLVADSSATTGLRYTSGTVQPNPVLNSAMQVWQRGTTGTANSFAAGSGYNADRWQNYYAGSLTTSRQSTNDTTNLPFIQYCARVQRNSGQTNTGGLSFGQTIESINSIPFVGKTVTFSYYARAGANYSATSNALGIGFYAGTGTDGNVFFGFTGTSTLLNTTSTLTTTWQRFTHTFAIGSSFAQLGFVFTETPTGTAGANDYFEVTGVQIDIGSVALPFRTNAGTIQGELAACQRYYYRQGGDNLYVQMGTGSGYSAANCYFWVRPPVTMRVTPTAIDYSTLAAYDNVNVVTATAAGIDTSLSSKNSLMVYTTHSSGITQYRPYVLTSNNSTSGYLGLSAEL